MQLPDSRRRVIRQLRPQPETSHRPVRISQPNLRPKARPHLNRVGHPTLKSNWLRGTEADNLGLSASSLLYLVRFLSS